MALNNYGSVNYKLDGLNMQHDGDASMTLVKAEADVACEAKDSVEGILRGLRAVQSSRSKSAASGVVELYVKPRNDEKNGHQLQNRTKEHASSNHVTAGASCSVVEQSLIDMGQTPCTLSTATMEQKSVAKPEL